jgi:phage FluMu protein Com|tara:strand:+ start:1445 stop:1906 length:462 start_codon:yes stop_codon:yes gene_type:complete
MSPESKVEKLKKHVDSNREQRKESEKQKKFQGKHMRMITDAPSVSKADFWCDVCELDFESVGIKVIIGSYKIPIAKYEVKCPKCKKNCIRRITDKATDPYYTQSRKHKEEQQKHRLDLLQPGQDGFKTLYGDPMAPYNEQMEAKARTEWKKTH